MWLPVSCARHRTKPQRSRWATSRSATSRAISSSASCTRRRPSWHSACIRHRRCRLYGPDAGREGLAGAASENPVQEPHGPPFSRTRAIMSNEQPEAFALCRLGYPVIARAAPLRIMPPVAPDPFRPISPRMVRVTRFQRKALGAPSGQNAVTVRGAGAGSSRAGRGP